jgi:fatty acid-binding protein DegV
MAGLVHNRFGEQKLRLQLMYGNNMAGADQLREALQNVVSSVEDKVVPVTLVLGAHAGPTVFGLAAAPQAVFDRLYN